MLLIWLSTSAHKVDRSGRARYADIQTEHTSQRYFVAHIRAFIGSSLLRPCDIQLLHTYKWPHGELKCVRPQLHLRNRYVNINWMFQFSVHRLWLIVCYLKRKKNSCRLLTAWSGPFSMLFFHLLLNLSVLTIWRYFVCLSNNKSRRSHHTLNIFRK